MIILAYICAIVAPFFYGLLNVIEERFTSSLITRVQTLTFYVTITNLLFTPVLFLFYPFQMPSMDILILTAFSGIFFILSAYPYFAAFKYTDTSIIAALNSLSLIFVPILSFIIIGEVVSVTQYIGFVIILLSAVLLSINKGVKFGINAAFYLIGLTGLLWSGREICTKIALAQANLATVYFFAMLFSTIFIIILNISKNNRHEIVKAWPTYRSKLHWFVLSEILQMAAMGFAMFAMTYLPLTIVVGLNQFQPIYVIIIGALVLLFTGKNFNEKLDNKSIIKKLICFAMMIFGAVLLA